MRASDSQIVATAPSQRQHTPSSVCSHNPRCTHLCTNVYMWTCKTNFNFNSHLVCVWSMWKDLYMLQIFWDSLKAWAPLAPHSAYHKLQKRVEILTDMFISSSLCFLLLERPPVRGLLSQKNQDISTCSHPTTCYSGDNTHRFGSLHECISTD